MPRSFILSSALELDDLGAYHQDLVAAFRLYFSPSAPTYAARFVGKPAEEVGRQLAARLDESDVRSAFAALTSLEASFRIDFDVRCKRRLKDDLSVYFRQVARARKNAVRLDEDILEGWKRHTTASALLISDLRGAFKFRHWIAHGRYWTPKLGHRYDFDYVLLTVSSIISGFPFLS